jgi:hypothetical protein
MTNIVAARNMGMVQLDMTTTILYGNLAEDVYFAATRGVVHPGSG